MEYHAGDDSPPPDNEQKLRHSVYSALAYGVKGIQWLSAGLMVAHDQCIKDVAAINAELKVIGPTLMKLRSVDVFHTAPLPTNTRSIPLKHWVHVEGEPTCEGIVMGMFKDEDDMDYIMFVNRDYRT